MFVLVVVERGGGVQRFYLMPNCYGKNPCYSQIQKFNLIYKLFQHHDKE